MNKVFEKIIERLKKEKKEWFEFILTDKRYVDARNRSYDKAIEIVKEVAEEFDNKEYEMGFEDGAESVRALAPYDDDWIPCSERLPECEDYSETDALLFQLGSGTIEVGYFGKKNAWRDYYFRHYRGISGVDVKDVIAWQPLPQPFKQKGE